MQQLKNDGEHEMSTRIDPSKVSEVLLADGWHSVVSGTFETNTFGFVGDGMIPNCGFSFQDAPAIPGRGAASVISGPILSIRAVRHRP